MNHVKELILYQVKDQEIFRDFTYILDHYDIEDHKMKEDLRGLCYDVLHRLIEVSESHGFEGNLWHNYLTWLIVNHENAYSMACEIRGMVEGSINGFALHDFAIFKELFDKNLVDVAEALAIPELGAVRDYCRGVDGGKVYNTRIRDNIVALSARLAKAESPEHFQRLVAEFYKNFGVGKLGLHKAFRIEHTQKGAEIMPITNIAHVHLDDLVGYELAKEKLVANTEAFVKGKRANNCLLFGDAGTGKSTSIKAIVNQYYDKGLRMIEIYKHQFQDLNSVIAQIKNRNYKFIIYMDDLSFEEFEIEYKYLKAVIEGGLERKPDNILIYATSNRRHLVREKFSDKEEREDDLHKNDTVQEKLSLVARFGVKIYFGSPTPKEFKEIVRVLAEKNGVAMPTETLLAEANKWELSHGGLSGRCAQQFIDYLLGQQ